MRLTFRKVALLTLFLRKPCMNLIHAPLLNGQNVMQWLAPMSIKAHYNWNCKKSNYCPYTLQLFFTTAAIFSTVLYMDNDFYKDFFRKIFVKIFVVCECLNFVMGYLLIIMFGKKFCEACCTFLICSTFRICFIHGLVHMWRSPDHLMLTVYLCFYHVLVFS